MSPHWPLSLARVEDLQLPYVAPCLLSGCNRQPSGRHKVLATGVDINNAERTIELDLCEPHGIAFSIVSGVLP